MSSPASMDWFTLPAPPTADRYELLEENRRRSPVQHVPLGGPESDVGAYVIYRRADVLKVLSDTNRFSTDVVSARYGAVLGSRSMIAMSGEAHRRYRHAVASYVGPQNCAQLERRIIVPIVQQLVDELISAGQCDLVPMMAAELPGRAFAQILGLPSEMGTDLTDNALSMASFAEDPKRAFIAATRLRSLLKPLVAERRSLPSEDLISALVRAESSMTDPDPRHMLETLLLLVWAGIETTFPGLSVVLHAVLTHDVKDWAAARGREGWRAAINEALRWETPVQITARLTTVDITIASQSIPAGSIVLAHLGSANRDENWVERGNEFDPSRAFEHDTVFGYGIHRCIGASLAWCELENAVVGLFETASDVRTRGAVAPIVGEVVRCPERLEVSVVR